MVIIGIVNDIFGFVFTCKMGCGLVFYSLFTFCN